MKEHYVSFEQAVKLKELGFDWYVRWYYTRDDNFRKVREVKNRPHNNVNKFNNILSAPRLDQAARWLREVKGIFVGVTCDNSPTNAHPYAYEVKIPMCDDRVGYASSDYNYALSAGISKALELLGKEDKE